MTSEPSVQGYGPFRASNSSTSPYTGFSIASTSHAAVAGGGTGPLLVQGYVLVKSVVQWPHLNTNAEIFADVNIYKAMSLWDMFPVGDLGVMVAWLKGAYPGAELWSASDGGKEVGLVMARNIATYFNGMQQGFGTLFGLWYGIEVRIVLDNTLVSMHFIFALFASIFYLA